ncbi:Ubiquitin carboxyl-terminal hydrolase 16 [Liparis tanakae]|uniref:Ubiquitin carboxyl-terminal hydrolase n=1 Tax=Liparis tanakae TaxID=230148 RepID=A0A4Z2IAX1_9TELE|nr:Ubiquitin carboxyl-terminal hydrolase 16 [Liparis tanakae]
MGKKRGKDKSSREDDEIDLAGAKEEDIVLEVEQKAETVKPEKSEDNEDKSLQKKNTKKESVAISKKSGTSAESSGVSVKGLSNLGNTCFFNAVMQNLSQTQLLRQTLSKVAEDGISLNITPVASSDLAPISMQLGQPGSLTLAMCQLLNEIQESKKGVVTPRELFTQVCKKAARFKGFQQQDSQELLRYLLDGMRAEEIKAYRKKNQKKTVQKTSESSQDGGNSPPLTNGNDDISSEYGSKYQQKKAKKQAKKQAKQHKRQQKIEGRVTLDSLSSPGHLEGEQTDPTADEKENDDNVTQEEAILSEGDPAQISVSEQVQKNLDPVPDEKDKEEEVEKEEEEEEEDDEDEDEDEDEDSVIDCDSLATSSVDNRVTVLLDEEQSKDSILDDDKISDMDLNQEEKTQLANEMEKVTLDDAFIEEPYALDTTMESGDEPLEAKEYTVVSQDPELAFRTLATRTAPEKQECSVQSCLFYFTEVETLTQNNSLLCVTCTKRQPKKDTAGGAQKNVYTDALKQMLISSPPPVLTLHLKRFQQNGYSICKVNRHVHFPLILDLASFCAVQCKNLTEGDAQTLYSLYGIVEHSGTMRSGHYTAYVKARPECHNPSSNGFTAEGPVEPPKGSWFHISDTCVQPVSQSKVQSCQAYLLFYERIC